jgi:LuxR family transcriptional regulator, maltose regulon positive regulatory protein
MPATPRLLAKLTRPRLHGAVARERLFTQLDDARRHRRAICVVGPPGAGKTTLVASWLDARNVKGIWYQVDAGDTDLATFFHYLGQAAGPYTRKGQAPLPALTPEYLKDIEGFSRRFFRELFSRLPAKAVVVLDNYQEVAPEQPLHALVAQAADEVPPGMLLIAISRRDPPDTYARLIANEHVELVDWDQLKLTLAEACEIAATRMSIDAAEVERLHATSGGWAAGLTLLLEGRRRAGSTSPDIPESRDAIFDYFAAQILARVPEATQRFLVATAFLPQVPVSIARELTDNADAGAILDNLYHRHLFTHRRPGAEPVYWYHALFRSFLKARAESVLGADRIDETMSRAARLLEAAGMFDDAFELFREARDWPAASRLIERRASDLLAHGRGQTLREWIQSLPADTVEAHPWVRYWLGASLVPLDQIDARRHLEGVYELFRERGEATGQALAAAGIIDSYVFQWTDFRPIRRWVDELDGLVDRLHLANDPSAECRIQSSLLLGTLYTAPGHPRLLRCVNRVTEMLDEQLEPGAKLDAAMMLLAYCNIASDGERGAVAVARGSALVEHPEVTPFSQLWWCLRKGHYHTLIGEYEESIQILNRAGEIATGHGFQYLSTISSLLYSYRSIATASLGDAKATRECSDRMFVSAETGRATPQWHAIQGRIYLACVSDDLPAIAALGVDCIEAARVTGMVYLEVLAQAHHAIGLAADGQRAALRKQLEDQRRLIRGTCLAHFDCEATMVEAWDALRHGELVQGRELLRTALRFARETRCRFVNIFRTTSIFRDLMAEALAARIDVEFVTETIRRFRVVPPTVATDRWPWPVKVHTLGRFELIVDGATLEFSGKAPRKPLALLKAIVALGSNGVPVLALIDTLWPEEEGDAARKSLDVTVARLRKLLGRNEAVIVGDESVSLNPKLCWVDAQSFQALVDAARTPEGMRQACAVYAGTFLPGDSDSPWSAKRREGLRNRFIRLVEDLGLAAEAQHDWDTAIDLYRRGLEADELAEAFHQGLMRCYRALGRHAEGMSAYRRLRQTLSVTLGISPSEQSQALARALQQSGAPV